MVLNSSQEGSLIWKVTPVRVLPAGALPHSAFSVK
jgi:hypothetical protein